MYNHTAIYLKLKVNIVLSGFLYNKNSLKFVDMVIILLNLCISYWYWKL